MTDRRTDPQLQPPADGVPWREYVLAVGALRAAREETAAEYRATRRAQADRAAELTRLGTRLAEQQRALEELATRLRAPLTPAGLTPAGLTPAGLTPAGLAPAGAVPATTSPAAGSLKSVAQLRADLDVADAALAEARRVAALPQLLPALQSPFARAAVVYAGFAVPSLLLTVALSLAGVRESTASFLGFAIVWPAVAAVAGAVVVEHVSRPRCGDAPSRGPAAKRPGGPPPRPRRYPWFGVLLAWMSWLVTGFVLDWLATLWPG